MAGDLNLPYGFFDARYLLLLQSFIGEFLQGGLVFGFNALSLIFKSQDFYNCRQSVADRSARDQLDKECAQQETKLAVLWTIGVFALNFGPVIVGGVLDLIGPKLTSMLGTLMNILALVLMGISKPKVFNILPPASVILGLAGITFHLSQLHISSLFPRRKGLVASLLVAGFTGCGIIFYILLKMVPDFSRPELVGQTRHKYQLIMFIYAGLCGLWIPLNFWMMPWRPLQVGQVFLYTGRLHFRVMHRRDIEAQVLTGRRTGRDKRSPVPGSPSSDPSHAPGFGDEAFLRELSSGESHGGEVALTSYVNLPQRSKNDFQGARGYIDSSDPRWLEEDAGKPAELQTVRLSGSPKANTPVRRPPRRSGLSPDDSPHRALENGAGALSSSPAEIEVISDSRDGSKRGFAHTDGDNRDVETGPTSTDVVWGPLVFESRRWVELRSQSFWRQFLSAESTGMGVFYTLNVFCIQFYLGTTRLQLEQKGDTGLTVTGIANVVPAFGFLGIPVIGWLLDTKGYGITLGTINFLGVVASIFQAMPSLWFQVVTLIVWCAGRFFLYTSYYAIFGALFGVQNFGRMVAIDNSVNGLFGLLQLPLTQWGLHGLGGNFTAINLIQVGLLLPLFIFAGFMYKWEREDLVPIRPNEGEELPCTVMSARAEREAKFLKTLERRLSGVAGET